MSNHITSDRFAIVPEALIADMAAGKVSGNSVALYSAVRCLWGGLRQVFPKQQTIAEKTGLSVATVKRCLKELNDTGWILSERQKRIHGNNEYFICSVPFVKPAQAGGSDV